MTKVSRSSAYFKELITEDYYYIDKTMYIEKLEKLGPIIRYIRPRKFGKSLFASTLDHYYNILHKDLFNNLFKDTYIYKHPTESRNSYYILKFDFSGLSLWGDVESIMHSFNFEICNVLYLFNHFHNLSFEYNKKSNPSDTIKNFFEYFSKTVKGKKLYIIIDEYDNLVNSLLSSNKEKLKEVLSDNGFFKEFYATLNEYTKTIVEKVYITGVTSIGLCATNKEDFVTDISFDEQFHSMTGFTEEEVKYLVKEVVSKEKQELAFNEMNDNYNGHIFNSKCKSIFNPHLVNYYLVEYELDDRAPYELLCPNNYPTDMIVYRILELGDNIDCLSFFIQMLTTHNITSKLIQNIDVTKPLGWEETISLLFYNGYISIENNTEKEYTFIVPNKVLEELHIEPFRSILIWHDIFYDYEELDEITKSLCSIGDIKDFIDDVLNKIKNDNTKLFSNLTKNTIQAIIYTIIYMSGRFYVYSGYEVANRYIDLYLKHKEKLSNYDIIIELKYINSNEYTDELFETKRQEAINQINKYRIDKTNLKKYILIFIGTDYKLEEIGA